MAVELYKLAMAKPLSAIVVVLFVIVVFDHVGLQTTREAVAVVKEKQDDIDNLEKQMDKMFKVVTQTDVIVKILANHHGVLP